MSLKKRLGFAKKTRTKDEIDREYTGLAIEVGHKSRIVIQLEQEIAGHLNRLTEINAEAMALQSQEAKNNGRPTELHKALGATTPEPTEGGAA